MLEHFKNHINQSLSILKEAKLLIAISGGLDSVVLTYLCHNLGLNIALAHCNFKLRGTESDDDEQFVLDVAKQLHLEVFVEHFDTESYSKSKQLSIQMAARELRYEWFYDLAEHLNFDYILTAHHSDDNIETFLINLTRGSGLKGLTGIPEINGNIVRPLLPFSRIKLEHYAKGKNIEWREDSSNASDNYLRNKLRHRIIPQLKEIAPELESNFNKTISNLKDSEDIVQESVTALSNSAISENDEHQIKFKISEFKKMNNPKAYVFEVFKDYGFTEWNDVFRLLDAQSGKHVFSETHRLIKDRDDLILTDRCHTERSEESMIITKVDKKIQTPCGTLFFEEADVLLSKQSNVIYVDRDTLKFPLKLRRWQKGDVFFPIGMTGKKKLSKYFKDEKFSLVDKENIWLLTSESKIVWIIGRRADERFKVTNNTKHILEIRLAITSSTLVGRGKSEEGVKKSQ